jgi:hypothetical protein
MTIDTQLGTRRFRQIIPVAWATAATEGEEPAIKAPIRMTVTAVRLVAKGAITGSDSAYATVSVVNRGAAGAGTASVASLAFDTATDDDVAAFTAKALTLGAAADLVIAKGDIITIKKAATGEGMAISGQIEIEGVPAGA